MMSAVRSRRARSRCRLRKNYRASAPARQRHRGDADRRPAASRRRALVPRARASRLSAGKSQTVRSHSWYADTPDTGTCRWRKEKMLRARPACQGRRARGAAVFLRLGLTSFGGPVAHLGYFRDEFVERRRWLDERGLRRSRGALPVPARVRPAARSASRSACRAPAAVGALAAWIGFTLALGACAGRSSPTASTTLGGSLGGGWLHGLKIVAVAVVAQAVLGHGAHAGAGPRRAPRSPWSPPRSSSRCRRRWRPDRRHRCSARSSAWSSCRGGADARARHAAARRQPARRASSCSRSSSRCWSGCRSWRPTVAEPGVALFDASTAPARWCSAAAMWCCRCCRPRWCRRAG